MTKVWTMLSIKGKVWVSVTGTRQRLAEYLDFAEKHGPDEPILRDGELIPVGEMIAHELANLME